MRKSASCLRTGELCLVRASCPVMINFLASRNGIKQGKQQYAEEIIQNLAVDGTRVTVSIEIQVEFGEGFIQKNVRAILKIAEHCEFGVRDLWNRIQHQIGIRHWIPSESCGIGPAHEKFPTHYSTRLGSHNGVFRPLPRVSTTRESAEMLDSSACEIACSWFKSRRPHQCECSYRT